MGAQTINTEDSEYTLEYCQDMQQEDLQIQNGQSRKDKRELCWTLSPSLAPCLFRCGRAALPGVPHAGHPLHPQSVSSCCHHLRRGSHGGLSRRCQDVEDTQ